MDNKSTWELIKKVFPILNENFILVSTKYESYTVYHTLYCN